MRRRTKWTIGGVLAGALLVGGIGTGVAQQAGDDDRPLTGETYDQATAAALKATGGGTVTDTEHGDDGAAYGVEVLRDDGSQVEVNLDREYRVISQELDDDADESGEPDDD